MARLEFEPRSSKFQLIQAKDRCGDLLTIVNNNDDVDAR